MITGRRQRLHHAILDMFEAEGDEDSVRAKQRPVISADSESELKKN